MARQTRFFVPGCVQHVIKRGNNRQPIFFIPGDRRFYRDCVRDAFARYECTLHAYVLMTNHVHLLVSPATRNSLPRAMQSVGRRYAQYVNWRHERTGTLWEGRYRATLIDSDAYFLACSRYIELNPVRAGMVEDPGRYGWSSYAANALGATDALVRSHPLYATLGRSPAERQHAYRRLFDDVIPSSILEEIRKGTHEGWPVGGAEFRAQVERVSGRRARPLRRGRRVRDKSSLTRIKSGPEDKSSLTRIT